eukprot:TRINITY_DN10578_c0_g2_i2.p1 TRINITY_DN10578_c0_g2~~TRINITY_DN10578_c0_g2_i2.p1  ORF type:complete len:706 (+),score=109.76 TRINITY_DN10578_c0_g2_i2:317-2119(+)
MPAGGDPHLANQVLVYGPEFCAISTDDGVHWKNLSLSNSSLGQLGCERVVRLRNGTMFASVLFLDADKSSSRPDNAFMNGMESRHVRRRNPTANSKGFVHRLSTRRQVQIRRETEISGKQDRPNTAVYRIDADDWSDMRTYTWTLLKGGRDGSHRSPYDLIEVLDDEHVLVVANSGGDFGVSRDGGETFVSKALAQDLASAPGWFNPTRSELPYGNGRLVVDPFNRTRWIIGTGFYPAVSEDEGDTWRAITTNFGEVCTYQAQSHPTRVNTTWMGVMDLSAFYFRSGDVEKNTFSWSFFNHQPNDNSYWITDYCHRAVFFGDNEILTICNHQSYGCGQFLRSDDFGQTWNLTQAADMPGISTCIPLIDIVQSPDDPQDLLLSASWGWLPSSASHDDFKGGLLRSLDGGRSWKPIQTSPTAGFVGTWFSPSYGLQAAQTTDHRYWLLDVADVFVSSDRGETWTQCPSSPYTQAHNGAIVTDNDLLYIVGGSLLDNTSSSFKVSSDHCTSWTDIGHFYWNYPMPGPYLAVQKQRMAVYSATMTDQDHITIWVTVDGGSTWQDVMPASKGEYLGSVSGLAWDGWVDNRLWVSTPDRSVVVLDI